MQQPIQFGEFEIDTVAGELRKNGAPVRLAPQPFRLLLLLASNPGRLVEREEIRRELWPEGVHVDFDQSLHFTVRQVREALGDDADRPAYVKTVPRRGYRFIGPVTPADAGQRARRPATDMNLQKALWVNIAELRLAEARRRRVLLVIAALIVVLIAIAVLK